MVNKRLLEKELLIGIPLVIIGVIIFSFSVSLSMLFGITSGVYVILDYKLERIYEQFMEGR